VPCVGLQVAVIEYARNVLHLEHAHSTEFDPECANPVVIFMPEGSKTHMGGTMRLGLRVTELQTTDCHAARLYRSRDNKIRERHRHRCASLTGHAICLQVASCGVRIPINSACTHGA
jgi:CTP synthase